MHKKFTLAIALGMLLSAMPVAAEGRSAAFAPRRAPLRAVLAGTEANVRIAATPFTAPAKAPARVPDDGREYTVVLEEDFSLCTAGSVDEPDKNYIENSAYMIPSKYTHTPGWGGRGIMQAGGAICIGKVTDPYTQAEMTGQIETPELDLHRDNGRAYLSFRAKALAPDVDLLSIRWVDNSEGLPVTGETQTCYIHGIAWSTVNVDLTDCPEHAVIQIWSEYAEVLIDDIKVEQYHAIIDAPKALKWTEFTGDSFNANWTSVEGADHYIFNCYYVRREGTEDQLPNYKYVRRDIVVNDTTYHVDGLNPEKVHYYYINAVNADGVKSEESQLVEVMALTVPAGIEVSDVTKDGFKVSWNPVLNAEGYGFQAIVDHTAPQDEWYAILDEPFDAIQSEGSVGEPYINPVGYYDMDSYGMTRANWVMYEGGVINGAIAFWNHQSSYGDMYYGELVSPIITIGQSTGEIKIEADFATLDNVRPYIQIAVPGVVDGVTQWVLGAGGEVKQTIGKDWTHVSLSYKVKPGLVRISIGTTDGGWLYMDNLKISINLPEGAKQRLPYHYNETTDLENPWYYCPTPDRTKDDKYSFALMAARLKPGSWLFPIYITSDWSSLIDVPDIEWDGVIAAPAQAEATFSATAADGTLTIANPGTLDLTITDIAGRTAARTAATQATIALPKGIYIISAPGCRAVKTIVK